MWCICILGYIGGQVEGDFVKYMLPENPTSIIKHVLPVVREGTTSQSLSRVLEGEGTGKVICEAFQGSFCVRAWVRIRTAWGAPQGVGFEARASRRMLNGK